jgi:outer membrane protein assembly factor BamD
MTDQVTSLPRRALTAAILAAGLALGAACGGGNRLPVAGSMDADRFLFARGSAALKDEKWITAREYFRRLIDVYPVSEHRFQAKLGIGDAYLGEGRIDSLILAANEFREFLTFYPVAPQVDYAQYKLAVAQSRQTLSAQRDQTATHDALREIDTFLRLYTDSPLRPEVEKLRREMRDLLSESEFGPGLLYYRTRWYFGAISRFTTLLKDDPEFTHRDKVYYYLAESYYKLHEQQQAEPAAPFLAQAQVFYEKLLADMPQSDYASRAQDRLKEIKR